MQSRVKEAGGHWHPRLKLWKLAYGKVYVEQVLTLLVLLVFTFSLPFPLCFSQTLEDKLNFHWGKTTKNLRIAVSAKNDSETINSSPNLIVAFKNVGDEHYILNLGIILGNGKKLIPSAVHLDVKNEKGEKRVLFCRVSPIEGRVDDYWVPLRSGSIYSLKLNLTQFWSTTDEGFLDIIPKGQNEIMAIFEGYAPKRVNSDLKRIKLMNFWKGRAISKPIIINVP